MKFKLFFDFCFNKDEEFKDFCYSDGFVQSEYKEYMIKFYNTKEKQNIILKKFMERNKVKRSEIKILIEDEYNLDYHSVVKYGLKDPGFLNYEQKLNNEPLNKENYWRKMGGRDGGSSKFMEYYKNDVFKLISFLDNNLNNLKCKNAF